MAGRSLSDDMHVRDFARVLRRLEPHLPVSDAYERDLPQLRGTWWSSQKEHMVRWFSDQDSRGSGAFTRAEPNTSARKTYNRLLCPAAVVWMAEALGEHPVVVQEAADAARDEPGARKRSGLLRKHLPWERIAQLAREVRYPDDAGPGI
ncbi:hypothetical protein [Mycetocola manganoxydans]|nr:hypothetical protein [Mycetocola manganoxydans]